MTRRQILSLGDVSGLRATRAGYNVRGMHHEGPADQEFTGALAVVGQALSVLVDDPQLDAERRAAGLGLELVKLLGRRRQHIRGLHADGGHQKQRNRCDRQRDWGTRSIRGGRLGV